MNDMTPIIEQFGQIIELVLPLAVTMGLSTWLIRFVLSCITGDYQNRKFF